MHNYFFRIYIYIYIYSKSLHVSSTPVLIIRRINCINTTSGICQLKEVKELIRQKVYLNPFQSNFSANRILPSSYLVWAVKRLLDYL
jgi:hypothetical protein